MKRKLILFLLSLALVFTAVQGNYMTANAEDLGTATEAFDINDFTEDALVGESQIRGEYLLKGTSLIQKESSTKFAAGGITNATRDCKVSLCVIVERKSGNSWVQVTSWSVINQHASIAISSKMLTVARGYYYRVRCLHTAATDASSSWTSALSMM